MEEANGRNQLTGGGGGGGGDLDFHDENVAYSLLDRMQHQLSHPIAKGKDKKQLLKDTIYKKLEEELMNLDEVKSHLKIMFRKAFDSPENAYIERKYVKYCVKLWQQEALNWLVLQKEGNCFDVILKVFNSLQEMTDLRKIPFNLNHLTYYKILSKHAKFVKQGDEPMFVRQFKRRILEKILKIGDFMEQEVAFLEELVNFLRSCENVGMLVTLLGLEKFYCDLSIENLYENMHFLLVDKDADKLIALTCDLTGRDLFLVDRIRDTLGHYLKPVEVKKLHMDGRLIVEVVGRNIVLSKCLPNIETEFSSRAEEVEEVRIIADVVFVDVDFVNSSWHGKNIVVLTNLIKVKRQVTWDVSGISNNFAYGRRAATAEDGHGFQGNDGFPGESGGNVLIHAECIEHAENWTIVSSGGKGGMGQNGGNGRVGEDGAGITLEDFKKKYPPCSPFIKARRCDRIKTTVKNIMESSSTHPKIQWYERGNSFQEGVLQKIMNDVGYFHNGNIFIHTMTQDRHEIVFSFEAGGFFWNCQSFFMYRGSAGNPGYPGGCGGLGGEPGFPGQILVNNPKNGKEFPVTKKFARNASKVDSNGQGGLNGGPGKRGWDMAYMDYSVSKFFNGAWPKYFGTDLNSKLALNYHEENSSDRVGCPYKARNYDPAMFAEITASQIEHKQVNKFEERNNSRENTERQHHSLAVRKKNVSIGSIAHTYSHFLNTNVELLNLKSDLDRAKQQALHALNENNEQQDVETSEIQITRQSTFQARRKVPKHCLTSFRKSVYQPKTDSDALVKSLGKSSNIRDWMKLQKVETNLSQLIHLFSVLDSGIKGSLTLLNVSNIKELLLEKYRFATLENIALQSRSCPDFLEISAANLSRYLIEAKEIDYISHPVLGTLNRYLFNTNGGHVESVLKFCRGELPDSDADDEILRRSYATFAQEVGDTLECAKMQLLEVEKFAKENENRFQLLLPLWKSDLSQPMHYHLFEAWNGSFGNESFLPKVFHLIAQDRLLSKFYNYFSREYDWDSCSKNEAFIKEHDGWIQLKGLWSETYRELVANVFGVNIRRYIQNEDKKLVLCESRNSASFTIIHILQLADRFAPYVIDENHYQLGKERKNSNNLYKRFLMESECLKSKKEFDVFTDQISKDRKKAQLIEEDQKDVDVVNTDDWAEIGIDSLGYTERTGSDVTPEMVPMGSVYYVEGIIKFYPEAEREELKRRLSKLSYEVIKEPRFLFYIYKRFSSEGAHVSFRELCYLVNSVLTSFMEGKEEQFIFSWIIAAHPQQNWIAELFLIRIEDYFKTSLDDKPKWRSYLSNIDWTVLLLLDAKLDQLKLYSSISKAYVEETLNLLSAVPNERVHLGGLELSEWVYALKDVYWSSELASLFQWRNHELGEASYYLLSIENNFGLALAKELLNLFKLKREFLTSSKTIHILQSFENETWSLDGKSIQRLGEGNINRGLKKLQEEINRGKQRQGKDLVKIMFNNANTSQNIKCNLAGIEKSIKKIRDKKYKVYDKILVDVTENDIRPWVPNIKDDIEKKSRSLEDIQWEMLAVIDRVIQLKRNLVLRDTQLLTVLALLGNPSNTLAQVATGEGKSFIVLAVSIIKALCGEKVDIVTSSSVLAKRDAEDYRDIYNLFEVNVGHNCSEKIEERKQIYSNNAVVYGNLANFQRDYLMDRFYGKNILGNRDFHNVIVDEVDSMLLDKGNNMLYLSRDMPGFDKLESVYLFIWKWLNSPAKTLDDLHYTFDKQTIKEEVISNWFVVVKMEDIAKLSPDLSEKGIHLIWKRLVDHKILDKESRFLKKGVEDVKLDEILLEFIIYHARLQFLIKELMEREKYIHVPAHLESFVESHLDSWINSAITAFLLKPGEDYVVDVSRTESCPDRNPIITILERDTGVDQVSSQWDEALHQFLQLKHGCKLSLQSLKSVFISNVSYFKLYKKLNGLTGTIGSQRERDLLQKVHNVDFVTVPTFKPRRFHEKEAVICRDEIEWKLKIVEITKVLTYAASRSVLVICDTVNDVETLQSAFLENQVLNVVTYIRDYDDFEVAKGELDEGKIIIATNLAGRGTDIKLSDHLEQSGGLHVILSYLPGNVRVEQQAFGRAARCGDQGSAQLIVVDENGRNVFDLKRQRNAEELQRLSDIKLDYETRIVREEKCFKAFKEQHKQLKEKLEAGRVPDIVTEILLQSCLDKWTLWLDENSKYLKESSMAQGDERALNDFLDNFLSKFESLETSYSAVKFSTFNWRAWLEGNPVHMVKLGKYLSENQEIDVAIEIFDKVIRDDIYFSETALYYKAYALAKKIKWEGQPDKVLINEMKMALQESLKLLQMHRVNAIVSASLVESLKKNNCGSIIENKGYADQKENLIRLYSMFTRSIDDVLGHVITPMSFEINGHSKYSSYLFYNSFLEEGILKKMKAGRIKEEGLKAISREFEVPLPKLLNFLSALEGKKFDEKSICKELKRKLKLPSREGFWKVLLEHRVLRDEIEFVMVDNQKLQELDSSLLNKLGDKVAREELIVQDVKADNHYIVLYSNDRDRDLRTFKKTDFVDFCGILKYKELKKKHVLLKNKKAFFDVSLVSSHLRDYDSISEQDLTSRSNINGHEAELILSELVQQGVLQKEKNYCYRLKIRCDEIEKLSFYKLPVYENIVKKLLHLCFTYREALEKLSVDIEAEYQGLQLISMPHSSLFFRLIEQGVINGVKATKNFNEKTVQDILNKRQVTESSVLNKVKETLKKSLGPLKFLDVPECSLKSLTEACIEGEFGNIEECHIFTLNGLDHFLQFQEKKWSYRMLITCGAVAIIGTCQIFMGVAMMLFSAGTLSNLGASVIGEGLCDLVFAFNSYRSGYCSWKDYGVQKAISLAFSTTFFCGGVAFAKFGGQAAVEVASVAARGKNVLQEIGSQVKFLLLNTATRELGNYVTSVTAIDMGIRRLCDDISNRIVMNIENEIMRHDGISAVLESVYNTIGDDPSTVMGYAKMVFIESEYNKDFLKCAGELVNNVIEEIPKLDEQNFRENINQLLLSPCFAAPVGDINKLSRKFLTHLADFMRNEVQAYDAQDPQTSNFNSFDVYKSELTEIRKSSLLELVEYYITSRILLRGSKFVGKRVQEIMNSIKGAGHAEYFEFLKKMYKEKQQKIGDPEVLSNSEDDLETEKYHQILRHLMLETQNADLLADGIEEGISLDTKYINIYAEIVYRLLKRKGLNVSALKINLDGDKILGQPIDSGTDVITIELSSKLRDLTDSVVFAALIEVSPEFRNKLEFREFRDNVVDIIRHDEEVRNHIQELAKKPIVSHIAECQHTEKKFLNFIRSCGMLQRDPEYTKIFNIISGVKGFEKGLLLGQYWQCDFAEHLVYFLSSKREFHREWHGGDDDERMFDSKYKKEVRKMNYRKFLTAEDSETIKNIYADCFAKIEGEKRNGNSEWSNIARDAIESVIQKGNKYSSMVANGLNQLTGKILRN